MREMLVWSLGWEDPLEEEMATYSSILAQKIPWIEEPGRLQSDRSQTVGSHWSHWIHTKEELTVVAMVVVKEVMVLVTVGVIVVEVMEAKFFEYSLCQALCWILTESSWILTKIWNSNNPIQTEVQLSILTNVFQLIYDIVRNWTPEPDFKLTFHCLSSLSLHQFPLLKWKSQFGSCIIHKLALVIYCVSGEQRLSTLLFIQHLVWYLSLNNCYSSLNGRHKSSSVKT